jgi:hypothetical protein
MRLGRSNFGRDKFLADLRLWPGASVRCVATIRPKSEVKPTCQNSSTDAFDPTRRYATRLRRNAARSRFYPIR